MREEENNTEVWRYAKDKCRNTFDANQPQSKQESDHPAEGEEGRKLICKRDAEVTEASQGWQVKADTVQKQAARELLSMGAWSPEPAKHLGSSVGVSRAALQRPSKGTGGSEA